MEPININGIEYATKEEAQKALDAIDPFVPKKDEDYYTYEYDLEGEVFRDRWDDDPIDRARLALGIVFRTEGEAKAHQQSVHNPFRRGAAIHALRTAAGDTGVDWADKNQNRYCPYWDHDGGGEMHVYRRSKLQPNDLPAFLTWDECTDFYSDPTNAANAKIALGVKD